MVTTQVARLLEEQGALGVGYILDALPYNYQDQIYRNYHQLLEFYFNSLTPAEQQQVGNVLSQSYQLKDVGQIVARFPLATRQRFMASLAELYGDVLRLLSASEQEHVQHKVFRLRLEPLIADLQSLPNRYRPKVLGELHDLFSQLTGKLPKRLGLLVDQITRRLTALRPKQKSSFFSLKKKEVVSFRTLLQEAPDSEQAYLIKELVELIHLATEGEPQRQQVFSQLHQLYEENVADRGRV
jgi:hypothetical protein